MISSLYATKSDEVIDLLQSFIVSSVIHKGHIILARNTTKSQLSKLISFLSGDIPLKKIPTVKEPSLLEQSDTLPTNDDRARIIKTIRSVDFTQEKSTGQADIMSYARDLSSALARSTLDNENIVEMAPEVGQAIRIMIPSIVAPNDLRDGTITISSDAPGLRTEQNAAISKFITEYFDEELEFSKKLPDWIKQALYIKGAKCLLVVPVSELDYQFNNPEHLEKGVESYNQTLASTEDISVFGFRDSYKQSLESLIDSQTLNSDVINSLESLIYKDDDAYDGQKLRRSDSSSASLEALNTLTKSFLSEEALKVIDNPDVVKLDTFTKKAKKTALAKNLEAHYKVETCITLNTPEDKTLVGHPLFIDLPPECVVPIYTPGTPEDHIGYFILIDEIGNPLAIPAELKKYGISNVSNSARNDFDTLFKAYGIKDLASDSKKKVDMISAVYQQVIDGYLTDRLNTTGINNVKIGTDNSVYKCMLSRYLRKRQTKMLFVPKDMLIYFTYKHNENGTGKSKLDDIKFILSLRITLLICYLTTAVNNAVDRRKLIVSLNEKYTGNIVELLNSLKDAYVRKESVVFSNDPDEVSRMISTKGLSISATGIAGLENYQVTHEANERTATTIDTTLTEDVKNQVTLGLGVPPSSLNNLSQDEYSKSIATTNLFFSRDISGYQTITCHYGSQYVRTYVGFDKILQEKIAEIIKSTMGNDEPGTKEEKADQGAILKDVIKNLTVRLPPPNISHDKAQFENLEAFIQSVGNAIDMIFPNELSDTDDQQYTKALTAVKASIKSEIIRKYFGESGLGLSVDIPDLDGYTAKPILDVRQILSNISAALNSQEATIKPASVVVKPDADMAEPTEDASSSPDMQF